MAAHEPTDGGKTTAYDVAGMVCDNCKVFVTEAVSEVPGVVRVEVDVPAGRIAVTTNGEPDENALAEALDEVGYELTRNP